MTDETQGRTGKESKIITKCMGIPNMGNLPRVECGAIKEPETGNWIYPTGDKEQDTIYNSFVEQEKQGEYRFSHGNCPICTPIYKERMEKYRQMFLARRTREKK
ncbi:hypothetical protein HYW76_05805 [Candidatus Pacearchaeota archaeon]|nr:hypothetical protein [Candidatus Pacearchaeota archaeon]